MEGKARWPPLHHGTALQVSKAPSSYTHMNIGEKTRHTTIVPFSSPPRLIPLLPHPLLLQICLNRLNHFIPHFSRILDSRSKVFLNLLKLLPITIHMTQLHALGPVARRKREFQIVGAKGYVVEGCVDAFGE